MRAIGKGSLASILAVGLHVTRIILWIAFVVLAVIMVIAPLASIVSDHDVGSGKYIEIAHHFVMFGVMLFVVNRLLEIIKTLRFGSPFVKENADRFRGVGYALLIGEGAGFGFGFISLVMGASADIEGGLNFITWLAIIAVFVLAEVFREGARMKEEQDLTV